MYTGYIDAGSVSPELLCECGRPLPYQHMVTSKETGAVLKFGINHLQEHLKIDAKTVSQIIKGFDVLDNELNEILIKMRDGWRLTDAIRFLPED